METRLFGEVVPQPTIRLGLYRLLSLFLRFTASFTLV
jgi:hypothetical protein